LQRATAELEDVHGLTKENHIPGTRAQPRVPFIPVKQQQIQSRDPAERALFKVLKEQAVLERRKAMDALHAKHHAYYTKLVAWHAQRRRNAGNTHLSRANRRATMLALREAAENDHAARKQREQQEREAVKQQHPVPTWNAFVEQQAKRTAAKSRDEPYQRDSARRGQEHGNGRL
jgi:hypothetical protein